MPILQAEFIKFHDNIRIGNYDENEILRDKRDMLIDELTKGLKDEKIPNTDTSLTFKKVDQGSYKMNTGIKPSDNDYDIDVGIRFDITSEEYDSKKLKTLVFNILDKQAKRNVYYNRPCVTIGYAAGYHVDLAIYCKNKGDTHIAWGKLNSSEHMWYESDPDGLTEWVRDVSTSSDERKQFRRCVKALKKWKEKKFSNDGNVAPPSIGLTIQAREAFVYKVNSDLEALIEIVESMYGSFVNIYDPDGEEFYYSINTDLPVAPNKNVYYKMTPKNQNGFYEKLGVLLETLQESFDEDNAHKSSKLLRKVFGDDFPLVENVIETKSAPFVTTGQSA